MSARWIAVLLGVLTTVFCLHPARGQAALSPRPSPPAASLPPVTGSNSVSGLRISNETGVWKAEFDYFYTGKPSSAALDITLTPQHGAPLGPAGLEQYQTFLARPEPGAHHDSVEIRYPGNQLRTLKVAVTMRREMFSAVVLAAEQVNQAIDWPDFQTWMRDQQIARNSPEENYRTAVGLIDSEDEAQLHEARALLEKLIASNPKFAPGYVELARIAMKSNWGPQGLHQAEGLLSSALQIQPDSINAKILLGYVYAHQRRFAQAEVLFRDASRSQTDNLWLWSNWGELLEMEGKLAEAIQKYRQAIAHPMTHDTYDRARNFAYERLLELFKKSHNPDQMEALYKQRIAEFGPGSCYSADYTRFLLEVRGDAQGAIDLAHRALNQSCDDSNSRELLGLAEYVRWASTTGPQQAESLNQARVYLPPGPKAIYMLARSHRTLGAARALVASGEPIDQTDNEGLNALAYALQSEDAAAAGRLLALGARPETPVGPAGMPVALIPVIAAHADGVRVMRKAGVDYSRIRYRGAAAIDIARQVGDKGVLEALQKPDATL